MVGINTPKFALILPSLLAVGAYDTAHGQQHYSPTGRQLMPGGAWGALKGTFTRRT